MDTIYEKLWSLLQHLGLPYELVVGRKMRISDHTQRTIQKIVFLAQWATNVDLGYRFELVHTDQMPRISSPQLHKDLLALRSALTGNIVGLRNDFNERDQEALRLFAEVFKTLPKEMNLEELIAMIATYHYMRHILRRSLSDTITVFEAHFPHATIPQLVQRDIFLGRLGLLYEHSRPDRVLMART